MSAQIHHGLTFTQYQALLGWNWSVIAKMEQSPRHVLHAVRAPDEDTPARAMLRAIHALVLEPEVFARSFAVYDGRRAGKEYDAFAAAHPGRAVLNVRERDEALETATAIRSHEVVARLLSEGAGEVTVTWTDEATGLTLKARLDWAGPGFFFDLKSYGSTDERIVARKVVQMGAHGQIAHYAAALTAIGEAPSRAYIVAAEAKGAQDVAVFNAAALLPDGATLRTRLLARLAECVGADRWPGRHPTVADLHIPSYARDDINPFDDI